MIPVTKPFLPPKEDYDLLLHGIWKRHWLTNMGPLASDLEMKLTAHLNVKHLLFVTNGTVALQIAIKALGLTGEIITTPFTYVATTSSIVWEGCKPVFVDIDQQSLNMDPTKIEAAITEKTSAIVATHVYGNPCDVEAIQKIADKHGLKVIYDAAHAFGVEKNKKSILNWGDLSILSFHATKGFNTVEGGAIVTKNAKLKTRIDYLKNFGFVDETNIVGYGINGKMNELIAAYGLLQLKTIDREVQKRKAKVNLYRTLLKNIKGIKFLEDIENIKHNYTYFPVLINKNDLGKSREEVYQKDHL